MSSSNVLSSPDTTVQRLLEEREQERQADLLDQVAFTDTASAPKAVAVIWSFIRSYDQHRNEMPLDQWLTQELKKYPQLWQGNAEVEAVARTLINSISRTHQHKASLQQHLDKGKSAVNWLARELEQDVQNNPELNPSEYAGQVQSMLASANVSLAQKLDPSVRHSTVPDDVTGNSSPILAETQPTIWDETSRLEISREINKQALLNAALNASYHGARILGQRTWNWWRGEENAPASVAMQAFFDSSLKSADHVGAQVAVSGGVMVAAKSGWLSFFRDASAEEVATTTYVGLERAKALYKLGQGDIFADTAINAIEQTTMVAARSLAQAAEHKGAALGAEWGAALGTVFGPGGTAIGGVVGGVVGRAAGKAVGTLIEKGGRKVIEVASKVVRKVVGTLKDVATKTVERVSDFFSSLFS
ncbi:DUF1269 domain-containing protein [Pseudomonas putida]|uniref:DUF1269 domain-containing protein n=1 Tax=Pseudomonas TaxID=286 RepID=UPI00105AAF51|nr:DUF1269 domain-containing protein [Pseudomonas putida]TDJ75158.1 DUF1269 domain-containing protein [Pseudomonas putida]